MILLSAGAAAGQDSGGTRSIFDLGGSARALGMGSCVSAVTDGGDGFFWNPAVLASARRNEILTFHAELFLDTLYDSLTYIHPVGGGGCFAGALARLGTSGIFETSGNIQPLSTFSFEQWQGLVGYGFRFLEGVDLGANVKYIQQQGLNQQGSDMGIDLGALYRFSSDPRDLEKFSVKNLTAGFSVSNILQPRVKMAGIGDEPDQVLRPSLSFLYKFPGQESHLWVTAEGEVVQDGGARIKAGAEYGWNRTVFARTGFDGMGPTAGAGVQFAGFQLDYAFNQRDLGSLHRFSLTYRFGGILDPTEGKRLELLKWVARSFSGPDEHVPALRAWENVLKEYPGDGEALDSVKSLKARRREAIDSTLKRAKAALDAGDVEKALPLISRLMSLDPTHPEVRRLLARVDQKLLVSTNYVRGVEAYGVEDYPTAVRYLSMVFETDPRYRDVDFLYHDALSRYQPLQDMPKELLELYALGVDHFTAGRYREAAQAWEKVLQRNPKNYLVRRNLEEARKRLKGQAQDEPAPVRTDGAPSP